MSTVPRAATARPLNVATPLGPDAFLLTGFGGTESLSGLFAYHLELQAPNELTVPLDQLVGQPLTVALALPGRQPRFFSGICARASAGAHGGATTAYRAEVVPWVWLLTRRRDCRIFQEASVPDVLRRLLVGGDVDFRLEGDYRPRNYCVQYRETDFDFASRLMEEEGIYFFFRHEDGRHTLVLGDSAAAFEDVADPDPVPFDPAAKPGTAGVFEWLKTQSLTAGKVTLRDHSFQLPEATLEVGSTIQEEAASGQVVHRLRLDANDGLELYDYPGGYAKRFDGVDPGGGDRPGELAQILPDGRRTAGLRMEEEAAPALAVDGGSTVPGFAAGARFELDGHFDADGRYLLTRVEHAASIVDPKGQRASYSNRFGCMPVALPFRPSRTTPRPVVAGPQTAVVVGPAGEDVFADRYGRVKVQFFWDREGQHDEHSSCWVRVSQQATSGSLVLPRIGSEVVVAFLEGDPDQPIVLGQVYDSDRRPPFP